MVVGRERLCVSYEYRSGGRWWRDTGKKCACVILISETHTHTTRTHTHTHIYFIRNSYMVGEDMRRVVRDAESEKRVRSVCVCVCHALSTVWNLASSCLRPFSSPRPYLHTHTHTHTHNHDNRPRAQTSPRSSNASPWTWINQPRARTTKLSSRHTQRGWL